MAFNPGWVFDFAGSPRDAMLAALRLVVALGVSAHVLLRKRDVGAATGWIGLTWISPVAGGVLYLLFGINRVRRRARRLRADRRGGARRLRAQKFGGRDDHLAPLEHAAHRITDRAVDAGNSVAMYHNGDTAYPQMLAAIHDAQASIGLSTYILHDDAAGQDFIAALIAARERGVAVRVLIDGIGGGYFLAPAWRRLRRGGVSAARFMHSLLPWRMPFLNLRSHKKILVIDGRIGFTGGMNIGAENLLARKPAHPVRDTHFRIAGPMVAQLVEAFATDWQFATDEELSGPAWFPPAGEWPSQGPATARVITSGPDEDIEKIEFVILQALACARQSVRLITPYFLPEERMVTALALAAMRNVAVDIIVPQQSNHFYVDWAARATFSPLLDAGCRIWLNPPPFEHSKLLVVDDDWSLVGSANWDMRSFRLNFELNVEIYDAELARQLNGFMQAKQTAKLTLAMLQARPLAARLRDAAFRLLQPYL